MARTVDQLPAAVIVNPTDRLLVSQAGIARRANASLIGGGGSALLDVSMVNAVTAATQLGTPLFVRRPGGFNTWDDQGLPTLTSSVPVQSYSTDVGLRFDLSASIAGGWIYPLTGAGVLPTVGVVLEVDIAEQSNDDIEVVVMPIARFASGNVTGFAMRHRRHLQQVDSELVDLAAPAPNRGTLAGSGWAMNSQWPTTPNLARALNRVRYEVKADGPQTPARWRIVGKFSCAAGLGVDDTEVSGVSGAADAVVAWDGLARPTLGFGIYRVSSGTGSVVVSRIRVTALED